MATLWQFKDHPVRIAHFISSFYSLFLQAVTNLCPTCFSRVYFLCKGKIQINTESLFAIFFTSFVFCQWFRYWKLLIQKTKFLVFFARFWLTPENVYSFYMFESLWRISVQYLSFYKVFFCSSSRSLRGYVLFNILFFFFTRIVIMFEWYQVWLISGLIDWTLFNEMHQFDWIARGNNTEKHIGPHKFVNFMILWYSIKKITRNRCRLIYDHSNA